MSELINTGGGMAVYTAKDAVSNRIDELEFYMYKEGVKVECPVSHYFIPGFYCRQIFMPAGSLVTSMIHDTEHPFFISKGSVIVQINMKDWEKMEAPYAGVTFPDTRRVLLVEDSCVWTTFHPISDDEQPSSNAEDVIENAVAKICERIIRYHVNCHLGGVLKNNELQKELKNETKFY